MCGRFAHRRKFKDTAAEVAAVLEEALIEPALEGELGQAAGEEATGRYNIRPSSICLVVRQGTRLNPEPMLTLSRWGYRPPWMTEEYQRNSKRGPFINARAETLFESRAFRPGAARNRCLVLADGFYEPKGEKGTKREQYFFEFGDKRLFAMAGIESAFPFELGEGGEPNFAILTCAPNGQVEPIHSRMPVLLDRAQWASWLDPHREAPREVNELLASWAGEPLAVRQVSNYLNRPDAEGPACIEPANDDAADEASPPPPAQQSLF
jgi:putative SOS response-associated peptidase YedK